MNAFDIDWVRTRFPGLANGFVYLDNAGGSLPARESIDRIAAYLRETPVQLGASYSVSADAAARLDAATRAVATLIGAPVEGLVMGPSTSALIGRVARAMTPLLSPGDEIVVTDADHEANITPWRRLATRGIRIRTWRVDRDTGRLEPAALAALLTDRTRLVAVTHVSNVTGSITPLSDVVRLARDAGAEVCVDGVAHAPHRLIDFEALDVDYYAFSFYKVFGPHHAVLAGKPERLAALDNLNHDFFDRADVPYKLQPGAHCYELTAGCHGVVDYLAALGERHGGGATLRDRLASAFAAATTHETALAEKLLAYLRTRQDVRIIGESGADTGRRVATVSFVVDGVDSASIPVRLDSHRIGIRYGDFYAPRLIDALGLEKIHGVVRVSMLHYNCAGEIDRLIDGLDAALHALVRRNRSDG